jgi:hypothetical protein
VTGGIAEREGTTWRLVRFWVKETQIQIANWWLVTRLGRNSDEVGSRGLRELGIEIALVGGSRRGEWELILVVVG